MIRSLPYTGVTLVDVSINDDRNARRITLGDSGALVDRRAALDDEEAERASTSRKLSLRLHQYLDEVDDSEIVRVSIRYRTGLTPIVLPDSPPDGGAEIADEFDTWIRTERALVAERIASERAELVAWLEQNGAAEIVASQYAPSLTADLPARLLLEPEIHDRDDVMRVGLDAPAGPEPLHAYGAHGAMSETAINYGACNDPCDFYPNVGIWERGDGDVIGAIATYNTRFQNSSATYFHQPTSCETDSDCMSPAGTGIKHICRDDICIVSHTTYVAASVGMTGWATVSVPGGSVWLPKAGTSITNFRNAQDKTANGLDWLLSQGVVHANRSQGVSGSPNQAIAWKIDFEARNSFLFLTQSSGNFSTTPSTCPSFNSVCVASYAYLDYRTPDDDVLVSTTSTINPIDAERPHLVGPDKVAAGGLSMPDINAPNGSNGMTTDDINGSSFASPAILSLANRMHLYEGFFSNLAFPIVKKAILMAGAADVNGDGPIVGGYSWTSSPDGLDGAGAPDGDRIKRILDANTYAYDELSPTSFSSCGTDCEQVYIGSVTVPGGYAIRATLAYNSCATGLKPQKNNLNNDLDLWIVEEDVPFPFPPQTASSTSLASEVEALYWFNQFSEKSFSIFVRVKGGTAFNLCGNEPVEPVAIAWDVFFDDAGST